VFSMRSMASGGAFHCAFLRIKTLKMVSSCFLGKC